MDWISSALKHHLSQSQLQSLSQFHSRLSASTPAVLRSARWPWLLLIPVASAILYAIDPYRATVVFHNLVLLVKIVLLSILAMVIAEARGVTISRTQEANEKRRASVEAHGYARSRTMSNVSASSAQELARQRMVGVGGAADAALTRPDLARRRTYSVSSSTADSATTRPELASRRYSSVSNTTYGSGIMGAGDGAKRRDSVMSNGTASASAERTGRTRRISSASNATSTSSASKDAAKKEARKRERSGSSVRGWRRERASSSASQGSRFSTIL